MNVDEHTEPCKEVLTRCVRVFEAMKGIKDDGRPKRLDKLKNVLRKETSVTYLSSILNVVLSTEGEVEISQVTPIHVHDYELDENIVEKAQEIANETNRILHVLPCDSNLQETFIQQLKAWYEKKDSHHSAEPIKDLVQACLVEVDVFPEQVVMELANIGFIRVTGDSVSFLLPEGVSRKELEAVLGELKKQWKSSLDDVTAKGYHVFSKILANANTEIYRQILQSTEEYCDAQYSRRYPSYVKSNTSAATAGIRNLGVSEMETSQSEETNTADELPSAASAGLPITMSPEFAEVVLYLCNMETKPATVQDLMEAIQPVCQIVYMVSPKYILANIASSEKFIGNKGDLFTLKLNIGNEVEKRKVSFKDSAILAKVLAVPHKKASEPTQRHRSQKMHRGDAMEVSYAGEEAEMFQRFQDHVLEQGEIFAQRHQSTLILNNPQEQLRCKRRFEEWMKSLSPTDIITGHNFIKILLELSRRTEDVPVDNLIAQLIRENHIQVVDGEKVQYPLVQRLRSTSGVNEEDKNTFKFFWKQDFKPPENSQGGLALFQSRKRPQPDIFALHNRSKRPKKIISL